MKINLNIDDEKEIRDMVKNLVKGQVMNIMRNDLVDIIQNSVKDKVTGKPRVNEMIEDEIKKQVANFFKEGYAKGPGIVMMEKTIQDQVSNALRQVLKVPKES
jgi:hypothetical protein